MDSLPQRLKSTREKRGFSQEQLAVRAGVGQSTIAALETDPNRATTKLVQIAKALNVTPTWLETGKGPMNPVPAPENTYIAAESIEDLARQFAEKSDEEIAELFRLILSFRK
ncbi:helix-turn-helix domain-containing protein [Chromobacterium haemolyticum]|uniref:helix-turn-helix domain-containing protein n=1 Tax=Chromobacterium haemolyticum TaxID=394935 RepID=UPI001745FDA0|nr:helix-turn-helix transcriptional regulator [Chromobacterium haemolyticum]QOD81912.1 helix-turn-helix domain-containing protein [Chromobacterium haemolyticum]